MLVAKGYPDLGWNPIEGERYLSFLRFAVFCNGRSDFCTKVILRFFLILKRFRSYFATEVHLECPSFVVLVFLYSRRERRGKRQRGSEAPD